MKLATTVGICQSELFIVKNRYIEERPKLRRNNDTINALIPIISGICTPNNITQQRRLELATSHGLKPLILLIGI